MLKDREGFLPSLHVRLSFCNLQLFLGGGAVGEGARRMHVDRALLPVYNRDRLKNQEAVKRRYDVKTRVPYACARVCACVCVPVVDPSSQDAVKAELLQNIRKFLAPQ